MSVSRAGLAEEALFCRRCQLGCDVVQRRGLQSLQDIRLRVTPVTAAAAATADVESSAMSLAVGCDVRESTTKQGTAMQWQIDSVAADLLLLLRDCGVAVDVTWAVEFVSAASVSLPERSFCMDQLSTVGAAGDLFVALSIERLCRMPEVLDAVLRMVDHYRMGLLIFALQEQRRACAPRRRRRAVRLRAEWERQACKGYL